MGLEVIHPLMSEFGAPDEVPSHLENPYAQQLVAEGKATPEQLDASAENAVEAAQRGPAEAIAAETQTRILQAALEGENVDLETFERIIGKADALGADVAARLGGKSDLPTHGDVMKLMARAQREMHGTIGENG